MEKGVKGDKQTRKKRHTKEREEIAVFFFKIIKIYVATCILVHFFLN